MRPAAAPHPRMDEPTGIFPIFQRCACLLQLHPQRNLHLLRPFHRDQQGQAGQGSHPEWKDGQDDCGCFLVGIIFFFLYLE
jgi:hypothetical protein